MKMVMDLYRKWWERERECKGKRWR